MLEGRREGADSTERDALFSMHMLPRAHKLQHRTLLSRVLRCCTSSFKQPASASTRRFSSVRRPHVGEQKQERKKTLPDQSPHPLQARAEVGSRFTVRLGEPGDGVRCPFLHAVVRGLKVFNELDRLLVAQADTGCSIGKEEGGT